MEQHWLHMLTVVFVPCLCYIYHVSILYIVCSDMLYSVYDFFQ